MGVRRRGEGQFHFLSSLGKVSEPGERGSGRQTTSQAVSVEYRTVEDFILGA